MNILIMIMTIVATSHVTYEDVTYDLLMDEAINNCKNADPKKVDKYLIKNLILIEKKYKVPSYLKGMILASACYESGYNPKARGDKKFSKNKKDAKAVGLFQMWPWWEKEKYGYGIDRENPYQAAKAFMKHIIKQIPSVKKKCKYKTKEKTWIAAWVQAIRSPKEGGRCNESPKHLKVLKIWHHNIKNAYNYPGFTWR